MAQTPPGWHREDIKAELRKRYGSLRALCRTWGLNRDAISNALHDPAHSVPTEMRIALALGVRPQVLWPDRWDASGNALPRPGRQHRRSMPVASDSQKTKAA